MSGATTPGSHVARILHTIGPCLSSEVVRYLVADGLTPEAARQRVSRSIGRMNIQRVRGIEFPHREFFLYIDDEAPFPSLITPLWNALESGNTAMADAVHSLHARGDITLKEHFGILSGSPQFFLKGHPASHHVLEFLLRYELLKECNYADVGRCICLSDELPFDTRPSPNRLKARLLAERIIIQYVSDWLRRMTLISYDSVKSRGEEDHPMFGQFQWDITAPSYVQPLAVRKKGQDPIPGFFAADIILGTTLDRRQIQYFMKKCAVMRYQPRTRPFLAMIIADNFSKEAFDTVRRQGIMAVSTENLTGKAISDALKALIETLTNAATIAAQRPEAVGELFDKLGAIEGAASNIRGPLFELMVAHFVREREGTDVDVGRQIHDPRNRRLTDIDVLRAKKNQEVAAYECKGHGPNVMVDIDEIQRWLTVTVPTIRNYLIEQDQYANVRLIFEFWTTGTFTERAREALVAAQAKTNKYAIRWQDGQGVLAYARSIKATRLVDVLQEQYLRHPVTRLTNHASETRTEAGIGN